MTFISPKGDVRAIAYYRVSLPIARKFASLKDLSALPKKRVFVSCLLLSQIEVCTGQLRSCFGEEPWASKQGNFTLAGLANLPCRSQLALLALFFQLANATDGWLLSSSNFPKVIFVRKQLTNSFDLFEDCPAVAVKHPKAFTAESISFRFRKIGIDRSWLFKRGIAAAPYLLLLAQKPWPFPTGLLFP